MTERVKIGEREFKTLLDTRAARSAIGGKGMELLRELQLQVQQSEVSYASIVNGALEPIDGKLSTPIEIEGVQKKHSVLVISALLKQIFPCFQKVGKNNKS